MNPTESEPASYRVHALDPALLADLRASGVDASGRPVVRLVATGDEPLRCCLRNARADESILLFGYAPPIAADSPYHELGAVFAHADVCPTPRDDHYPAAWRGRPQVLRAYDGRGWIHTALVHDGTQPDATIAQLFADPQIVQLHSRNVAYGCFMFVITRATK